MSEHPNGRHPPGSIARRLPHHFFTILDSATQVVATARKIRDMNPSKLARLYRKNAVERMLLLKVAFGPRWDPRKNRRGSQAACRCLCHLYSTVVQCYENMCSEITKILPLFAVWSDEDLICEDWFDGHVISDNKNRHPLSNAELDRIARPIEQSADEIDHHVGTLRDVLWREYKDGLRRVRSPAAPDPSPGVQKAPPALPRSPTPEAATSGPIPEAPADRIELAAAAPSENGTAATGGTPLAGSGRDSEALAAAPENSMPKTPKPDLLVDDLAVAAWTRLSKEEGRPPSIARVAREIGHTRQHLYRCRHFMSLVDTEKAERDERKQRLPRGWKEPSGKVEACQDEDLGDT